ncbi:hypothetical protein [Rothia sp. (in: high G+C Gram-positive bacteria)]|uniref:hypothetical protein n=1 Tax=Rothia sp. (in: high G+C Gram-positive bacteria) TaxID=1885016 RepID=UPI003217ED92
MSATKRESWGSLRKLPSGRWQARYPGPDGETYTARTEDDKSLTFLTKRDARRWLAAVHTKISLGQWEPPAVVAVRNRADAEQAQARSMGFEEYSKRWLQRIRTEPNRSGKMRAVGTVRSYAGKVTGYLVLEFGDTPLKEIDADRIREMTDRLDQIPAPLNPKAKFNGITRPVLIGLFFLGRAAMKAGSSGLGLSAQRSGGQRCYWQWPRTLWCSSSSTEAPRLPTSCSTSVINPRQQFTRCSASFIVALCSRPCWCSRRFRAGVGIQRVPAGLLVIGSVLCIDVLAMDIAHVAGQLDVMRALGLAYGALSLLTFLFLCGGFSGQVQMETFEARHTMAWNSDPGRWRMCVSAWYSEFLAG